MDDEQSFYDILQVPESASDAEIKKAYRELEKQFHPDRFHGLPADLTELRQIAGVKLQRVRDAYDVLRDSQKRALYDATRRSKRTRNESGPYYQSKNEPTPTQPAKNASSDTTEKSGPQQRGAAPTEAAKDILAIFGRRLTKLCRLHSQAVIGGLIGIIACLYFIPLLQDMLFDRAPTTDRVRADLSSTSELPQALRRVPNRLVVDEVKILSMGSTSQGSAKVEFECLDAWFVAESFESRLQKAGFDQAAFEAAIEKARVLPAHREPQRPVFPTGAVYRIVRPAGERFSGNVSFRYKKRPWRWGLAATLRAWWDDHDRWELVDVRWPDPPPLWLTLKARSELPAHPDIVGESAFLEKINALHVGAKQFAERVDSTIIALRQLNRQQAIEAALKHALAAHPLASRYRLQRFDYDVTRIEDGKIGCRATLAVEEDLFRETDQRVEQWTEYQSNSRYMLLRRLAIKQGISPPLLREGFVWRVAVPARSELIASFVFELSEEGVRSQVTRTRWIGQEEFDAMLGGNALRDIPSSAVFLEAVAGRSSVAQHRYEIETFCEIVSNTLRFRFSKYRSSLPDAKHFGPSIQTFAVGFERAWDSVGKWAEAEKLSAEILNSTDGILVSAPKPRGPIPSISYTHIIYHVVVTPQESGTEVAIQPLVYILWRSSSSEREVEEKYRRGELLIKHRPAFRQLGFPGVWSVDLDAGADGTNAGRRALTAIGASLRQ